MENQVKPGTMIYRLDHDKGEEFPWNRGNQQHGKEPNALSLNKKIFNIIAEREAAIEERNRALAEKEKALAEREAAIAQRDLAIQERNEAIMERDNALIALQHAANQQLAYGVHRGTKRMMHFHAIASNEACLDDPPPPCMDERGIQVLDALRRTLAASKAIKSQQVKQLRERDQDESAATPTGPTPVSYKPQKGKRAGKDLNRKAVSDGLKSKNEWIDHQAGLGLNQVTFDESIMPVPGCSCTGTFRHCYKWANGGWQSSCCTTSMSQYPLPQMPNRRYGRMGGRKMSGTVFTRLLSRLAFEGSDLSRPVDLKEHWSKHGTNRYITIK
ncbi:Protein BASIC PENTACYSTEINE4-like [Dionaea muscipula]